MMAGNKNEAALQEIEKLRAELVGRVNANVDALVRRMMGGGAEDGPAGEYEYPLGTAPGLLKGTKPAAVIFGGERVEAGTWKNVYATILRRCDADEKTHGALMVLRNKISGRKRVVLSDGPAGMNKPVMLSEGLYAESYFDTEWLLRTLVHILEAARFDYSGVSVAVRGK